MRRDQYAWGSFRRTGRQLGLFGVLIGAGFVVLVVLILVFRTGE